MARIYLNNGWKFTEQFTEELLRPESDWAVLADVRLPHTVKELPMHYFDEAAYQMVSGYCRTLDVPEEWRGQRVWLTFEGAAHDSRVYLNGEEVGAHHCGYTAFTLDLTDKLRYGQANRLVVRLDSRERLNIPPFGFVIDYMTYGGIYREVYLDVKNTSCIQDAFVRTRLAREANGKKEKAPGPRTRRAAVTGELTLCGAHAGQTVRQYIRRAGENPQTGWRLLGEDTLRGGGEHGVFTHAAGEVTLWEIEDAHPALYEIRYELAEAGRVLDEYTVQVGFREAVFRRDGFYLNGRKVKLRGLNRHQSYPYVGYAMPASMQRRDAELLKYELGCNAVRTSHYPQSQDFVRRCDELGLLVFTELPGWQHIGDDTWKEQAVQNVKDMVRQYRNHPSVILWGVRINESVDDDALYRRTNDAAHRLDPTRPTGGVRCYKKGSLLEDVFTYNDFVHTGRNQGCEPKAKVTSDDKKPYLISEYGGHMYPGKAFDWEEHRAEQALRHANVLDAVAAQTDIAGSFGWCMFDYNTHKDFGSGDRICYHGVMDMFRNPKLAAAVYASQQEDTPVLELSSSMDIGEHPGSNRGDVYIFTNAEQVRVYKNDRLLNEYTQADSRWKHLAHGPILLDDYVGDALETEEGMPHAQAEAMRALLNTVARVGLYAITPQMLLKWGQLMLRYHMKLEDATRLYNKYIGSWGGEATVYRLDAIRDGEVVKSITKAPMHRVVLRAEADRTALRDGRTYDVAAVRIRAEDEHGNVLPYFNEPVFCEVDGPVQLIGPAAFALQGGMGGTYLKTTGQSGPATLRLQTAQAAAVELAFEVTAEGDAGG